MPNFVFNKFVASARTENVRENAFRASGNGINKRFNRFQIHWQEHLAHCMEAQSQWCKEWDEKCSLSVLGAGRLLDLALGDLQHKVHSLRLYDADPGCLKIWKRTAKSYPNLNFDFSSTDFTGLLDSWDLSLNNILYKASWDNVLIALQQFGKAHAPSSLFCQDESDSLISLNTLSQIPIYWRHIVEQNLQRSFGKSFVKKRELEWLEAITPSAQLLIEQHLRDFSIHPATSKLIISDTSYLHYYGALSFNLSTTSPLPISLDTTEWGLNKEVEDSISKIECIDALYGFSLEERLRELNNNKLSFNNSWLWHISPKGCGQKSHGELHLVQAYSV